MARIVIADDDELIGTIVCDALLAAGHAAGHVTNGRDALLIIRRRKPDLVILDCNMPEITGILVLRELRQSPAFFDLPVLMLTGRASEKDIELALYQGASDYLTKPFDPGELVHRVTKLLKKRPQVQSGLQREPDARFGRQAHR